MPWLMRAKIERTVRMAAAGALMLAPPAAWSLASVNNDTGAIASVSITRSSGRHSLLHIDSNPPNGGVIPLISADVLMLVAATAGGWQSRPHRSGERRWQIRRPDAAIW